MKCRGDLDRIRRSQFMPGTQFRRLLSDPFVQRNDSEIGRLEKDLTVLPSKIGPAFAKRVDENLN